MVPTSQQTESSEPQKTIGRMLLHAPDGDLRLEPLDRLHVGALREASLASSAALLQWLGDWQVLSTREEAEAYVALRMQRWQEGSEYWFALVDAGGVAGVAFLNTIHPIHRFANLGYWVRTDRTGRGYASAATRLLARFGFEHLGLQRIEIVVEVANQASQRVAEKAGAVREGVLRNRLNSRGLARDAVLFSLIPADLDR